jgi:hypothetical protein
MFSSMQRKIQLCIVTNFVLLMGIIIIISKYSELQYGYSDNLVILGITINTQQKYIFLHCIIFLTEFIHSIIYEYANPILYFNVFNDERKHITDFGKNELQLYAQSLWFMTCMKNAFMLFVSISQIDIILCKILYYEIAVALVIRNKLNNKIFNTELHQVLVE